MLTEPRCSGIALTKECKRRGLVCTGKGRTDDLLAAIVYDPKVACEFVPELGRLSRWQPRIAGIRI